MTNRLLDSNVVSEDEALMRRYLLGSLSTEEQTDLEQRFFEDDQYFELLEAAETDLIDDYVRAELPQAEVRAFEVNFLVSSSRRRRIEIAEALRVREFEPQLLEKFRNLILLKLRRNVSDSRTGGRCLPRNSASSAPVFPFRQAAGESGAPAGFRTYRLPKSLFGDDSFERPLLPTAANRIRSAGSRNRSARRTGHPGTERACPGGSGRASRKGSRPAAPGNGGRSG